MSWMKALADCYLRASREHAGEPIMLLSDIDGTIIDMRHAVLSVLQSYDRAHDTEHFNRLQPEDITAHENHVEEMLDRFGVPGAERPAVMRWYLDHLWSDSTIMETHRPFRSVFPMIRWFQLQPNTSVALVTGRPETLRKVTLQSLNRLGEVRRVSFSDDLLFMNPGDWQEDVTGSKVAGLAHFRDQGYHVFAVIDNEPLVLEALAQVTKETDMLLLHADTIFESRSTTIPRGIVRGNDYGLTDLVPGEQSLPEHVQLVWHGVNDEANLRQFITSGVFWAEVDVRIDPSDELILRHDSFETTPALADEEWLTLDKAIADLSKHARGIKLDLKSGDEVLERLLRMVAAADFGDGSLWFNGNIEIIGEKGFRTIRDEHPDSIVQCPVDWLRPLIQAAPSEARKTLEMLTAWGINRFSISWEYADPGELLRRLTEWGYQVNFYNVPDLETFLEAVILLPASVTSDFNFPQWHRYGRGSGKRGRRFNYAIETGGAQA